MTTDIRKMLDDNPTVQDENGYHYTVVDWTDMNMIALNPKFLPVFYGGNMTAVLEGETKGFALFGVKKNGTLLKHCYRLAVQIGG